MGHMGAMGMAEATDIDTGLSWHFRSNHYPPIPQAMIEPAKKAIEAGNEGDFDRQISLADIVTFKGATTAPAGELIGHLHLDAWIDYEEEF